MALNEISIPNNKIINSRESMLYIDNGVIYKIFKDSVDINQRIEAIKVFLDNEIDGCPQIYDFLYKNSMIIGYSMKYYSNAIAFSQNMKFNFITEKCGELIDIYLNMKNNYNLCYSDFHNGNVCINNSSILLFDIDSCAIRKSENKTITDKYLCDYVLSMMYRVIFFDNEIYFLPEEREKIRKVLYEYNNGQKIETIENLKTFVHTATKHDIKKVLKRVPYNIKK